MWSNPALQYYGGLQVEMRKKEQQLSASQRVIQEQEDELVEFTKELVVTERENSRLRHSIEKMRDETDFTRFVLGSSVPKNHVGTMFRLYIMVLDISLLQVLL